MPRHHHNLVLAYQTLQEGRREDKQRLWAGITEVLVYSAVWGAVGALLATAAGAVFLWGVLIANAAR